MGRGTRDRFTRLSERKRAVRAARKLAPSDGSPDGLVSNVAAYRGRPIVMMPMPLPAEAPSGMWVSTEANDYLIYPAETTPTRRTAVICHEVGHMLMGHDPGLVDESPSSLLSALAPDLMPGHAARVLARHGYNNAQESDAEYLATVLVTLLARAKHDEGWSRPGSISARLR